MDNKLPHQFEKLMFQSNAMQTKAQGSNQYLGKAKVAFWQVVLKISSTCSFVDSRLRFIPLDLILLPSPLPYLHPFS